MASVDTARVTAGGNIAPAKTMKFQLVNLDDLSPRTAEFPARLGDWRRVPVPFGRQLCPSTILNSYKWVINGTIIPMTNI